MLRLSRLCVSLGRMGCNPDGNLVEGQTCEGEVFLAQPYRQVELSTYCIDQTEVTWAA